MKQYRVGIIGCTGMVGQRFTTILKDHPWFKVTALAASASSAGKTYEEAVAGRWAMREPIPADMAKLPVYDAQADMEKIVSLVDFVFCAVNMKSDEIMALEEAYAKLECPVISNNKQHRGTPDVPMIIPELNADHHQVIEHQRQRLGTKRGFIAVKCNCSLQSYVPAIHPLLDLGVTKVLACTYQAISGASKTFDTMPEIVDNVIPYIGGEEEKSEQEPLKIWGHVENGVIVNAAAPSITSQCLRVPVSDGHTAAVFFSLEKKVPVEEIIRRWQEFKGTGRWQPSGRNRRRCGRFWKGPAGKPMPAFLMPEKNRRPGYIGNRAYYAFLIGNMGSLSCPWQVLTKWKTAYAP